MLNDTLEKCHLKFLRYTLGVNKHAPNLAVYGDSGRFPLATFSVINTIKYLHRILNITEQENCLLYNAFIENRTLNITNSWYNKIDSLLTKLDISINDIAIHDINTSIRQVKTLLQSTFVENWNSELFNDNRKGEQGNKLRTYRKFKTTFMAQHKPSQ